MFSSKKEVMLKGILVLSNVGLAITIPLAIMAEYKSYKNFKTKKMFFNEKEESLKDPKILQAKLIAEEAAEVAKRFYI